MDTNKLLYKVTAYCHDGRVLVYTYTPRELGRDFIPFLSYYHAVKKFTIEYVHNYTGTQLELL